MDGAKRSISQRHSFQNELASLSKSRIIEEVDTVKWLDIDEYATHMKDRRDWSKSKAKRKFKDYVRSGQEVRKNDDKHTTIPVQQPKKSKFIKQKKFDQVQGLSGKQAKSIEASCLKAEANSGGSYMPRSFGSLDDDGAAEPDSSSSSSDDDSESKEPSPPPKKKGKKSKKVTNKAASPQGSPMSANSSAHEPSKKKKKRLDKKRSRNDIRAFADDDEVPEVLDLTSQVDPKNLDQFTNAKQLLKDTIKETLARFTIKVIREGSELNHGAYGDELWWVGRWGSCWGRRVIC